MTRKKRQMIFAPELYPNTFVFLFERGDRGTSWSIRDYSVENAVSAPRYAHEFNLSANELWGKVEQNFDAASHPTSDLSFWHRKTVELNQTFLRGSYSLSPPRQITKRIGPPSSAAAEKASRMAFPIFQRGDFDTLKKSRKLHDLERILYSRSSEDWVTWTVFRLLEHAVTSWWADLVALAIAENPRLTLPPRWEQIPLIQPWETVPSPLKYEKASRERMRRSDITAWIDRSRDPKPVEGPSEIDLILRNDALVVFVEAKLGSDISLRTKYDPARNQIVRNVDCLLDHAGNRSALFWMIVRDPGEDRAYTQLLKGYRSHPNTLAQELPHQDGAKVVGVARDLALLQWKDIVPRVVNASLADDAETAAIKRELRQRVM
jgi:hypothetical protein